MYDKKIMENMADIHGFLYSQGRKVAEDERRIKAEEDALEDPHHDDNGYDQIAQER